MKCADISDEKVLAAVRAYWSEGGPTFNEPPVVTLPYPRKVILAKMRQMVKRGILDYGVSLESAWVVDY